uniref:Uncharacterized protein n=1 Tax=Chromera velia CCMP2878 TaxID=1169474 RepID=A0A0G4HP27_9ALVE|eukprot:Cvel_1216.t1-p1 / transcript=Cvel_1216.t1 / gene=Cvel_1216 / organism=Chromera_velia_CCMP2878 / gene_product=hypothetical protein / transcript_product=hypothetical protein / location=Cvel_scaffold40:122218-131994(-) / protein_length=146 / sequence_SO=supercontig / SO=protein_coding / is_pseudo=false
MFRFIRLSLGGGICQCAEGHDFVLRDLASGSENPKANDEAIGVCRGKECEPEFGDTQCSRKATNLRCFPTGRMDERTLRPSYACESVEFPISDSCGPLDTRTSEGDRRYHVVCRVDDESPDTAVSARQAFTCGRPTPEQLRMIKYR